LQVKGDELAGHGDDDEVLLTPAVRQRRADLVWTGRAAVTLVDPRREVPVSSAY
jgi:hypothetical protein